MIDDCGCECLIVFVSTNQDEREVENQSEGAGETKDVCDQEPEDRPKGSNRTRVEKETDHKVDHEIETNPTHAVSLEETKHVNRTSSRMSCRRDGEIVLQETDHQ